MFKSTKLTILAFIVTLIAGLLAILFSVNIGLLDMWVDPRISLSFYEKTRSLLVLTCGLMLILSSALIAVKKKRIAGFLSLAASIFLTGIITYYCSRGDYRHIWNISWTFPIPFLGLISFITTRKVFEEKVKLKPFILVLIAEFFLLPWAILTIADGIFPLTEYRAAVLLAYPAIWIAAGLLFLYLVWFSYTFSSQKNGILCCAASFTLVFFVVLIFFKPGTQLFLLDTGSVFLFVPIIILSMVFVILATISHFKKGE